MLNAVTASSLLTLFAMLAPAGMARPDDDRLVPSALEPFEPLIGDWRAHGFLEANKTEGWDEPTTWGWRFDKGKIVGMQATFKDGRYFIAAKLDLADEPAKYRLTATTPGEKEVVYEGSLKGKNLALVRKSSEAAAPDQVTLQLLHDVRYAIVIEARKSTTLVRKVATIGATRADVRFGAASKEEQGPKCIITGAPGTSTVSYMGQTYYVCCSGCRAEFEHDPEKWLKLAREGKNKKGEARPATNPETADPKTKDASSNSSQSAGNDSKKSDAPKQDPKRPDAKDAPRTKETETTSKPAATLLARAKLLEKNGKRDEAIKSYERLQKDFPKSAEAKEAEDRLKELRRNGESG